MLGEAAPHMPPELEMHVRPPAPERGADVLRAYVALRAHLAGEVITHVATGEGARVQDILRFYAGCGTSPEIEGVEVLQATLKTLDDAIAIRGVSATTPDRVLLVITDADGRYLAHVLQPRIQLS
jgi:hypothetical protein